MNKLFLLLVIVLFASCSLAPFTSTKTARSIGKKNWELTTGFSPAPTVNLGRGFSENFDMGVNVESQMFYQAAIWGKYAFRNKANKDFSFSMFGGLFQAIDLVSSNGFYIGPVISYKYNWFETYLVTRYNWVHWDAGELNSGDRHDSIIDFINWEDENISYLQLTYGLNFWFTQQFALNLSLTVQSYWDDNARASAMPGVELIFKF